MTNYNDGKWHKWNGEDMKPASVHDKSIVEYLWHDEKTQDFGIDSRQAGWDESDERPAWVNIQKFRVVKECCEPREFWVCGGDAFDSRYEAETHCGNAADIIHVREVLE